MARGAAAATPLPRPEGAAAAKMEWCAGAWVAVVRVLCGGLQGFKFPGMESFLGSKSDTVISCDTESSDL
jgi:hypothetical protein